MPGWHPPSGKLVLVNSPTFSGDTAPIVNATKATGAFAVREAIALLGQVGFDGKERFAQMAQIASLLLPNEVFAIHSRHKPIGGDSFGSLGERVTLGQAVLIGNSRSLLPSIPSGHEGLVTLDANETLRGLMPPWEMFLGLGVIGLGPMSMYLLLDALALGW